MRVDPTQIQEFKRNLPADLIAALDRRPIEIRNDLRVEGWKPSFFGRLIELLTGRRRH